MDSTSYSKPDGFLDHDGAATRVRRRIEAVLLALFERYGYEMVQVPTLEYVDLYHPGRIGQDLFHRLLTARLSEAGLFPAADPQRYGPWGEGGAGGEGGLAEETPRQGHRLSEAVLRPEFTAPIARWFVSRMLTEGRPVYLPTRIAYAGQIFRNVDPGAVQLKEFRQVGVELIGSEPRWGDLEALCLASDAAAELRLPGWQLFLGHARLYREILISLGLSGERLGKVAANIEIAARILRKAEGSDQVFANYVAGFVRAHRARFPADHPGIDHPESRGPGQWRRELPTLHDTYLRHLWAGPEFRLTPEVIEKLLALARLSGPAASFFPRLEPFCQSREANDLAADLAWLCAWLEKEKGINPVLTPAASRGLAYYTGITFEIHCDLGASPYTDVCGGGRYDELHAWLYQRTLDTQAVRGQRSAAPIAGVGDFLNGVGLAFGIERLAVALAAEPAPAAAGGVFIAVLDEKLTEDAFRLADRLRRRGVPVACHLPGPHLGVGTREQIGHADRLGVRFTVLYGPDEAAHGKVTLRDMAAHQQELLNPDDAVVRITAATGGNTER